MFAAARSYFLKSAGLCFDSELANLAVPFEIKRIVKDLISKGSVDLFTNQKVKEILREINTNKFTVHTEVLAKNHLAIFYPLPYFRTEPINLAIHEDFDATKY